MANYVTEAEKYQAKKQKLKESFLSKLGKIYSSKIRRVDSMQETITELQSEVTMEKSQIDDIQRMIQEES